MPANPFDAAAPMAALKTLLEAVSPIQTVYVGTPESGARRVIAYIAFLGPAVSAKAANGLMQATLRLFVGIGYRVDGAEQTAEQNMAAAVIEFAREFYANRNSQTLLGGSVNSMELSFPQTTEPLYLQLANQTFRVTPAIAEVTQQETIQLT